MRHVSGWRILPALGVLSALMFFTVGASAAGFHGIAFNKGCNPTTPIGQPYSCGYQILNVADTAGDTLRITSLIDNVFAATGTQTSPNIINAGQLVASGGATCVGGSGSGTAGDPYVNSTSCDLPAGAVIIVQPFSFYTVEAADYTLPGHVLTDQANLTWFDLCDFDTPPVNCPIGAQNAQSGSQTLVTQLSSETATEIHNAAHEPVLVVAAGTTVHDKAIVTGQPGQPNPTGNVTFDWFLNGDCSGDPAQNSGPLGPLDANGEFDATSFAFTVNSAGFRAFRAHYLGDATYTPSDGPCEPLQVVDANIQITPPTAVNAVGTNHTLTGHVNVNDGSGFANAPAGTQINFAILSGPGEFVGGTDSCVTVGTTGECTVQITSAVAGTTVVEATTDVNVAGVVLHRETDGTGLNSAPAEKNWVAAKIEIAPDGTNEVGDPHTFTVTVSRDTGSGYVGVPGVDVDFTLTDALGAASALDAAASTCDDAGPNTDANGECTIVFTSPTAGTVTGNASASVPVGDGTSIAVATDGTADNSGPALKTFVDANIQINPPTAVNPLNTNHTLTGHVNVNDGSGFANAPAGTRIDFAITSGPGSFVGDAFCLTVGATGSCTVDITSPTAGLTVIEASTDVDVAGITLHRETDGTGSNSGPAEKQWVAAKIEIAPDATNEVGDPHTFTVTVSRDTGSGYQGVPGVDVDFLLSNAFGAAFALNAAASTCDDPGPNTDANGQCTIVFTSPTAGQVTGHASANVPINGTTVLVETNGVAPNSDDAVKTFVDARISVTPDGTNPVGATHTFTGHVEINEGQGAGWVNAPDGTSISFTEAGPGDFTSANPCTTTGGTGSCTVNLVSNTVGTSTVNASTSLAVGGQTLNRTTNGLAGNSGPATKVWVNANIQINPPSATNPLNTTHTLTITVNALNGTLDAGTHTATASIVGGPGEFVGGVNTCTYTGGGASASCDVVITSAVAGTTEVSATSDIPVSGVTITRTTNTAVNTAAGGSGNALKTWVGGGATLLIIDEDSLDNGIHFNALGGLITPSGPNFFSKLDVNDDKPGHRQRDVLRYFQTHVGETITVKTGQTGDEGWFAPNCIPQKWLGGNSNACLTDANGRQQAIDNYFGKNGPGAIPPQSKLDKIPHVIPLRALGLNALVGKTVCAVVYDSDVSINYDHGTSLGVNGNLQGEVLGIVAFRVDQTTTLNGFSSSTLPQVTLTILDTSVCGAWTLFNAPVPRSSSVPNDRIAPGSPAGYRSLSVWANQPQFY